jgi:hypothetical protein
MTGFFLPGFTRCASLCALPQIAIKSVRAVTTMANLATLAESALFLFTSPQKR